MPCAICDQVLRTEEGDSSIIEGLCSRCTVAYYGALKDFSEDFAFAALHSQDAIRLFVLRLRFGYPDDEDIKELLDERAAEILARLPASFAPWWRDAWTHEKCLEMKAARKAVGWTLAALNAPPLQRLAAMLAAEQDKVKEMEARHQRELEAAWEAGAMEGVQEMEGVMGAKLEELEAEHKKQMAAVTEASAEASNAVGEAAEKIRHDARRRGYADGYAFADQKATKAFEAMRADLERLSAENKALRQKAEEEKQMVQRHLKEVAKGHAEATAWEKEEIDRLRKDVRAHEARVAWHADMAKRDMEANVAKIQGLEAQVADHSRWRDEANHVASVAQLEAKKLRTKLAEADWDREQLVKAVEALRFPTQKLMASNPELFGGEARGTSSPSPPAIIRLPPVKEEDKKGLVGALKSLVPLYCGLVEESTPTPLPGIVEAQPSTDGLCEVWTVEASGEKASGTEEAELPDQLMASSPPEAKPKPNYNHPNWPSPITKRFAKHLAKHSTWHPKTIKTHEDALEFIAKRANISVETLLTYPIKYYQTTCAPWTLAQGGSQHFHTGTAPATWWC